MKSHEAFSKRMLLTGREKTEGFWIPTALLGYAEQSASDLLVVGAYSHARLNEALLDGTTRTLLAKTPMPILMST
jgi:nucleotide-binding universal stress UspA family protein